MSNVIIYTKESCPYCRMTKEFFTHRQIPFKEILVDKDPEKLNEMIQRSNRRTVPQIFIDGQSIGGYDDLAELAKSGKLNDLLHLK